MIIVELQVFYRDRDGDLFQINQAPSGQETAQIKLDVRKIVQTIRESGTAEYYYMVVKVRKSDGEFGYRTMIPKTMLI